MRLLMLPSAIELLGSCAPSSRAWRESSRTCSAEGQNHPAAGADVLSGKGLETAAWSGAPGGSRTPGPRLRRPLLYPAELQARRLASYRGVAACTVRRNGVVCLDGQGPLVVEASASRGVSSRETRCVTNRGEVAERLKALVC